MWLISSLKQSFIHSFVHLYALFLFLFSLFSLFVLFVPFEPRPQKRVFIACSRAVIRRTTRYMSGLHCSTRKTPFCNTFYIHRFFNLINNLLLLFLQGFQCDEDSVGLEPSSYSISIFITATQLRCLAGMFRLQLPHSAPHQYVWRGQRKFCFIFIISVGFFANFSRFLHPH